MNVFTNYVGQFVDSAVDIGGDIITFMTAPGHELALIGPVMFIIIALTGIISRFFKN